jgi:hypothetical protein
LTTDIRSSVTGTTAGGDLTLALVINFERI